jgi:hypothetical protein
MRTVIFTGLILISDAISAQTGYEMTDFVVSFSAAVLVGAICLDIIYVFKK